MNRRMNWTDAGRLDTRGRLTARAGAAMALLATALLPPVATGATTTDPFRGRVAIGAGYDDNLFRLENEAAAVETLGTDQLDDWYGYASAGFDAQFAGDQRRIDVDGEVYHRAYDTFDSLDHTGGAFNLGGTWSLSEATEGALGYGYRRRLQSFTNKDSTSDDIVDEHGITGAIERALGERWQVRLGGGWTNLQFSTTDTLDKDQLDGEAEIRYAASQRSIFGLLGTYTESNFDNNEGRDFSGWSVGPSFHWQLTTSTEIEANFGYTHRGLDQSQGDLDDYDGVTGHVQGRWSPGDRFSTELRVFRDVSNLGGEISEYTERTGVRFRPVWQMTPKLSGTFSLAYEERDFSVVETTAVDREDDYLLAELGLALAITQRLLTTLTYGYEQRDSNESEQEFDANMVTAELQLTF